MKSTDIYEIIKSLSSGIELNCSTKNQIIQREDNRSLQLIVLDVNNTSLKIEYIVNEGLYMCCKQ